MNTKKITIVGVIVVVALTAVGVFTFQQIKKSGLQASQTIPTPIEGEDTLVERVETESTPVSKPTTENPADQGDVRAQPAYLVSAYTRHEVDYIGVDYVMVFKGDEAVSAMIEDGVCTEGSECQAGPEGYIRNNNPHFRAYEISTTTPLTIDVSGPIRDKAMEMGLDTSALTFENLKAVLDALPQYVASEFPFKEAKSFVYIDIFGQGVTKIREP